MTSAASAQQAASWIVRDGLRELELLFKAVLSHPSEPFLMADDDRHCLDASSAAGKLLGLSKDKIIGRRIDDLLNPSFQSHMAQRWRTFLEQGEQDGAFPLDGSNGNVREVRYIAKSKVWPGGH